ncbi:uncharacterized protein PAC_10424 [Phialocephala subalpina]|uniref:DUF7580 domain-containing protein n=1 Tax=Phialocephala subalpina TaxID=576137 RepID=A0A1L7X683_9HELO|nr:uncharacterized protein PAC_10424 [Phialocephala subalpina]
MLTGVETAGLVLAVLPLLISALEHYKEGLEPVKLFLDFHNQLPSQIHRLTYQHVQLELTLRLLLSDIVEGEDLADMIARPLGSTWKGPKVQGMLKGRLRESYKVYERTVARMQELMGADLEARLMRHTRLNGKFEFTRRVKFSMSKKKMKNLLNEFDDCNRHLDGFASKTGQLESFEPSSRSTISPPFTDQTRSYTRSLYRVICLGLDCQAPHRAKLQLEQRHETRKSGTIYTGAGRADSPEISFTLSILVPRAPEIPNIVALMWRDTRIKTVTSDEFQVPARSRTPAARTVRFSPNVQNPGPSTPLLIGYTALQEMQDICSTARQSNDAQPCLGFYLDCQGELRGVYPVAPQRALHKGTVSLAENLSSTNQLEMSLRERLVLGAILASSYLQLQATPWLSSWSKEDIIFNVDRGQFDPETPCIAHTFRPNQQSSAAGDEIQGIESNNSRQLDETSVKTPGNSSLLGLGIIHMELYTGHTLEQYCGTSNLVSNASLPQNDEENLNNIHRLYAAHQWLQNLREKGRLSNAYIGAVHRCLQGYLDFSVGKDEAEFREKALKHVVLPVEQEKQFFIGVGN